MSNGAVFATGPMVPLGTRTVSQSSVHSSDGQDPSNDSRRRGIDTGVIEGLLRTLKLAAEVPWFGDDDKKTNFRITQYARRLRTYWKTSPQSEEIIRARLQDAFHQLGAGYYCYGATDEMLTNLEEFEVHPTVGVDVLVKEILAHPPRKPEDGIRAICAYFEQVNPRAEINDVTEAILELSAYNETCKPLLSAIAERVRELFADVLRPGEMPSVQLAGAALKDLLGLLGPHIYQYLPYRNKDAHDKDIGGHSGAPRRDGQGAESSPNPSAGGSNTDGNQQQAPQQKKRTRRSRRSREPVVIKDENPFPYPGTKRWGLSCVFCGNDNPPHRPKNCPVAQLAAEKGVVRYDSKVPGWLESQTGSYLPRPPKNNIADQDMFPVEVRRYTASYAHTQGWSALEKPPSTPEEVARRRINITHGTENDDNDSDDDSSDDESANTTWYEKLPEGTMGRLADVIHQEVFPRSP